MNFLYLMNYSIHYSKYTYADNESLSELSSSDVESCVSTFPLQHNHPHHQWQHDGCIAKSHEECDEITVETESHSSDFPDPSTEPLPTSLKPASHARKYPAENPTGPLLDGIPPISSVPLGGNGRYSITDVPDSCNVFPFPLQNTCPSSRVLAENLSDLSSLSSGVDADSKPRNLKPIQGVQQVAIRYML